MSDKKEKRKEYIINKRTENRNNNGKFIKVNKKKLNEKENQRNFENIVYEC